MNSRDIFAILALVTGIGVYLSTTGGSATNAQGGGRKTIKRRHNKHRGTKSLRTKK